MKAKQEKFKFNTECPIILFDCNPNQQIPHFHNCLELNHCLSGTGNYIINHQKYPIKQGDIFVINNQEPHYTKDENGIELTVLLFNFDVVAKSTYYKEYLRPFFQRNSNFSNRISTDSTNYSDILRLFTFMHKESGIKSPGWQLIMESSLLMLLSLLYRHYSDNEEMSHMVYDYNSEYNRLKDLYGYIDQHLTDNLTLDELADHCSISKNYLCRYFKEENQSTIFEYILERRITYACQLLKDTGHSITEIAGSSGFNSTSYFNKTFKKMIHMTPSEYRIVNS